MKKLSTLNDLLFEQTISIHTNTKAVIEDLHYLIERSNDPALKNLLKKHFDTLRLQEQRVNKVFNHFESNYPSSSYEIKEMLKNIFCRIGRCTDTLLIDAVITVGLKQISGYMTTNMNIARDLALSLDLKHLREYIDECLKEETRFLEKLNSFESAMIS